MLRRSSSRFLQRWTAWSSYSNTTYSMLHSWKGDAYPSIHVVTAKLPCFRSTFATTTTETSCRIDSWQTKLEELKTFVSQHGHSQVPQSHPILGNWVNANRKEYKKMMSGKQPCWMTPERARLLESVGFVWDVDEVTWMDYYEEMCQYRKEHGNW